MQKSILFSKKNIEYYRSRKEIWAQVLGSTRSEDAELEPENSNSIYSGGT